MKFLVKIYITSKFNFYEKTETLLVYFWEIIYITSEFNFYEKTETSLVQFCVIIYITSEFDFYEKTRNFIDSISGNNLHN